MTAPHQQLEPRDRLRAHLNALGLPADEATLDLLLPGYPGLLSGVARVAMMPRPEDEPASVFRVAGALAPAHFPEEADA